MKYLYKALAPFFLYSFLFISFGCSESNSPAKINAAKSFLALGDSYTIGTGINPENSWPNQLSDSLRAHNAVLDTTIIIATNGWTTTDLKKGITEKNLDQTFDLVSLLIGVNNQYQGMEIGIYEAEFRQLLEQAISYADNIPERVFVVSIPNYGATPFAQSRNPDKIREEIVRYNEIAQDIATELNVGFMNITPISELAVSDQTLLASDNLHPSEKMYAIWIEAMLPEIKTKIEK
ncbi:MAG: SGNH/GDSL hydrolase family protein [Balneolaceae bacterium]